MNRVLGTILRVLLTVFVVITVGFLLLVLVLLISGEDAFELPPILMDVAIVYLVDIALLLLYFVVLLIRHTVAAVRQGRGKALLKSLLIQVPLAIVVGILLEGIERLIVYGNIWEGGLMGTPIILAVVMVMKNVFPKSREE